MVRMSVPVSRRWVANPWRKEWVVTCFAKPRVSDDAAEHPLHGAGRDRMARDPTRKQEGAPRMRGLPVLPKDVEQPRAEHHVAVLRPLAVVDVDEHPFAVDVGGLQRAGLGDPQPGAVRGHQDRAVLERGNLAEESFHLLASQDIRQGLRLLRPRNVGDHLRPAQRRPVEELDRGDVHVVGRRAELPLVHEVQQELADLWLTELRWRPAVVRDEVLRAAEVLLLRRIGESSEREVGLHLVPDEPHGVFPFDGHVG